MGGRLWGCQKAPTKVGGVSTFLSPFGSSIKQRVILVVCPYTLSICCMYIMLNFAKGCNWKNLSMSVGNVLQVKSGDFANFLNKK